MSRNDIFKFSYQVKNFPDAARIYFLENAKTSITAHVKDTIGNLARGILDVQTHIDGNKIIVQVRDLKPRATAEAERSSNYFNEVDEKEFFNIVSETEFKDKVRDSAKKIEMEILRLITEAKSIFSR